MTFFNNDYYLFSTYNYVFINFLEIPHSIIKNIYHIFNVVVITSLFSFLITLGLNLMNII